MALSSHKIVFKNIDLFGSHDIDRMDDVGNDKSGGLNNFLLQYAAGTFTMITK